MGGLIQISSEYMNSLNGVSQTANPKNALPFIDGHVYRFWDVNHTKETPAFRGDNDRAEWEHYVQLRSGQFGIQPKYYSRGDSLFAFALNEDESPGGDNIEILSPTQLLVASCNAAKKPNDLSYVLRLWHAGSSVLLTGDVEDEAWCDLEKTYGTQLRADFLQASHHGRDSGFHASSLKLIAPRVVVVSVGRKPSTDAHAKYKTQCANVWSTRYYGNLTLQINDDRTNAWAKWRKMKKDFGRFDPKMGHILGHMGHKLGHKNFLDVKIRLENQYFN